MMKPRCRSCGEKDQLRLWRNSEPVQWYCRRCDVTTKALQIWTYDIASPGKGILIRTPEGRSWTRVTSLNVAKKIVGTFNFAMHLHEAAKTGEMSEVNKVLARMT